MEHNLWLVMREVEKAQEKLERGARLARDEMMARLIQLAKEQIKGDRDQVGYPAESGKPPMNVTGNLRRSIRGEKFRTGFASYSALVGPTIIYGRRVELGGGNWPSDVNFPYMRPAFEQYKKEHYYIMRKHLTLRG